MALAVIAAAGGDGASWEMARWTPAQMPGSASVSFEASEKPADRAGRQTRLEDEHLYDMRRPGWAPVSLALAGDTPWPSVHLPALPGGMESHDVAALSYLDARDHPGVTVTMESIVVAAATGRVRALGGSLSEAEMRAVLTEAGWPVELHDQALAVAWCESKWSNAAGDRSTHPDELGKPLSVGIMQLGVAGWRLVTGEWLWWNGWFRFYGYEDEQATDPVINATVAYLAYQRSGWGPWSCKP